MDINGTIKADLKGRYSIWKDHLGGPSFSSQVTAPVSSPSFQAHPPRLTLMRAQIYSDHVVIRIASFSVQPSLASSELNLYQVW